MAKQFVVFSLANRYPNLTVVSRHPIDTNLETTLEVGVPEKEVEDLMR